MNDKTINTRIQIKRDTSTNWEKNASFKPLAGEIIFYTDLGKIKIGDGVKSLSNLPFMSYNVEEVFTKSETEDLATALTSLINTKADSGHTHDFSGYALYYISGLEEKQQGSSTKNEYLASKWSVTNVNNITVPFDGMSIAIRTPAVGYSGGILLSIDGGNTYYPIVRNVNTLVTTTYATGSTVILTFNSTQTAKPYTSAGVQTEITGCWQTADYDANTDAIYSGIGTCSTAAATAAKVVTLPKFALATNATILVRVNNTNSATSGVTLNVNSTGAKPVKIGNLNTVPTASNFPTGDYIANYDGTNWILTRIYLTNNYSIASVNKPGLVYPAYISSKAATFTTSPTQTASSPLIEPPMSYNGRYYAVEADVNGRLFVNVPWYTTTYTFGTGDSQGQYKVGNTSYSINGLSTTSKPEFKKVTAESFYATSDRRKKENIKEFSPQKSILELPIVEFDFKDSGDHQIGCIAQDLQEICPEIVSTDSEGYLSINENKIVYLLLDEIKKLKEETNNLKKEILELKK